ncbi:translation initiation factor Sui1 [bacterium]|nr:translation initiation factor Sui1 [bacterium]
MAKDRDRKLVYSSEGGRACPECGAPVGDCRCRAGRGDGASGRGDGVVRVGRETKGRKGAGVTVVAGAPLDADGLRDLAGALKKACGSGGTLKDGVIEIQGEHRDRIVALLQARGWTVKRVGG